MDTLQIAQITRHFERIGARLRIERTEDTVKWAQRFRGIEPFTLDVDEERRSSEEQYLLKVRPEAFPTLRLQVLDVQPSLRHLLLLARTDAVPAAVPAEPSRLLCGHDERHWFVAAIKSGKSAATGVIEAMESLKPPGVARLQHRMGLRARLWNRRKNPVFQRQGEWFFLPERDLVPPAHLVLNDEAIRRSNIGKPHLVEYLYRDGGEAVYVCDKRPAGITTAQHAKLLHDRPEARAWGWRAMRRNMAVYAQGKIRHADHATLHLRGWHRVVMSGELLSARVALLD